MTPFIFTHFASCSPHHEVTVRCAQIIHGHQVQRVFKFRNSNPTSLSVRGYSGAFRRFGVGPFVMKTLYSSAGLSSGITFLTTFFRCSHGAASVMIGSVAAPAVTPCFSMSPGHPLRHWPHLLVLISPVDSPLHIGNYWPRRLRSCPTEAPSPWILTSGCLLHLQP